MVPVKQMSAAVLLHSGRRSIKPSVPLRNYKAHGKAPARSQCWAWEARTGRPLVRRAQDVRAGDAQADGLVRDALVVAGQARRLRHDLLPDALVVEEPLARAVQEPAVRKATIGLCCTVHHERSAVAGIVLRWSVRAVGAHMHWNCITMRGLSSWTIMRILRWAVECALGPLLRRLRAVSWGGLDLRSTARLLGTAAAQSRVAVWHDACAPRAARWRAVAPRQAVIRRKCPFAQPCSHS